MPRLRRRRNWGCSISRMLQWILWMCSQRICPIRFVPTLLARVRSAATSIAILFTPRGPLSSNKRLFLAIANHFNKRDIGWFNKYHFMKMSKITNEAKKLLGNTKGPNSKMAWLIWLTDSDVMNHWISKDLCNCVFYVLDWQTWIRLCRQNWFDQFGQIRSFHLSKFLVINYIVP